ncbi:MAG: hypothetical protein ABJN22_14610 [Litorimonas sp.]
MIGTNFNLGEAATVDQIEDALRAHGPQTGMWLSERFSDVHPIGLWRMCYGSNRLLIKNCARYYLRYDVTRENMLRLSPSILRDFLTFSLIYLPEQGVASVESGTRMANRFRMISLRKLSLAREALLLLPSELLDEVNKNCVVFLSGDIAYYLAHDTPRQHDTLGVPIKGSDIDIVIISNLESDSERIAQIDAELLKIKRQYLISPDIREELDFIVKPVGRMIDQLSYNSIHEKIATKILYESYFLMGRVDIYQALMRHLDVSGARARIEADFEVALGERKQTIGKIMNLSHTKSEQDENVSSLFYASQERLEFT